MNPWLKKKIRIHPSMEQVLNGGRLVWEMSKSEESSKGAEKTIDILLLLGQVLGVVVMMAFVRLRLMLFYISVPSYPSRSPPVMLRGHPDVVCVDVVLMTPLPRCPVI